MIQCNDKELLKNVLEQMAAYGTSPHGTAHLIDVGTDGYAEYFRKEVINDLVSSGGATCKFFEGAYGSGKSHILQLLSELAFSEGMIVANTDLSQALSLTDWRLITEYILQSMEAKIDGQLIKSLPEILAFLGEKNEQLNLDNLRRDNSPCPGFKKAMILATQKARLREEAWEKLKDFLLGRKIGTTELKGVGIVGVKGNLTQRNAEYVLKTVLSGLYSLGFSGTILLFDENEKTLNTSKSNPPKKNRIAANLMRRMIDGCTNGLMVGTVVVFAVLPGFLEICSTSYQALGQRLQIVRGGPNKGSWRWPVLPVNLINIAHDPEEFLEKMATTFVQIIDELNGNSEELFEHLVVEGKRVLESNVGTGYKRELMKVLSSVALERL